MSMKIITGSTGTTHVTSNNDGELQQGIFGSGLVILANGNQLKATVVDNNTIRVEDGDLIMQGRHALIEPNTDETLTIATGTVGQNRIDLIVAHYEMDTSTGYEDITLRVIKGNNSTGTPTAPAITEGDIRTGAQVAETVLYEVKIEGISIASLTPKAKVIDTILDSIAENKSNITSVTNKVNNAFAIITGTLTAGATELVISNSRIKADSIIDPYFWAGAGDPFEPVSYSTIKVENGKVTMTFGALDYNLRVGIRLI